MGNVFTADFELNGLDEAFERVSELQKSLSFKKNPFEKIGLVLDKMNLKFAKLDAVTRKWQTRLMAISRTLRIMSIPGRILNNLGNSGGGLIANAANFVQNAVQGTIDQEAFARKNKTSIKEQRNFAFAGSKWSRHLDLGMIDRIHSATSNLEQFAPFASLGLNFGALNKKSGADASIEVLEAIVKKFGGAAGFEKFENRALFDAMGIGDATGLDFDAMREIAGVLENFKGDYATAMKNDRNTYANFGNVERGFMDLGHTLENLRDELADKLLPAFQKHLPTLVEFIRKMANKLIDSGILDRFVDAIVNFDLESLLNKVSNNFDKIMYNALSIIRAIVGYLPFTKEAVRAIDRELANSSYGKLQEELAWSTQKMPLQTWGKTIGLNSISEQAYNKDIEKVKDEISALQNTGKLGVNITVDVKAANNKLYFDIKNEKGQVVSSVEAAQILASGKSQ